MAGAAILQLTLFALQSAPVVPGDPLDPLTASEIVLARETLRESGRLSPEMRFGLLALREPAKGSVLGGRAGQPYGRSAEAWLFDWATSTGIVAQIDLRRRKIFRWDTLSSREPPTRIMVRRRLEEIVRRDPRWAQSLGRRGVPLDQVSLLGQFGEFGVPWEDGRRVIRARPFGQEAMPDATWLRGLRIRVDLTRGTVAEFTDTMMVPTLPSAPSPRAQSQRPVPRPAPFTMTGSLIRWKNWQLRFGLHPRRGLELWDVGWIDRGSFRPILYRASVSEAMAVYGDPRFALWYPRDAGNEGLGNSQYNAAVPGGDVPDDAVLADAVMADDLGHPAPVAGAIGIYERDGGTLWRHSRRAVRGRQLVLTSHATIDNYDFVFNWVLGEDGAIDVEVLLTGLMLVYRTEDSPSADSTHGSSHLVAPGILAPVHQHFFSYRLDFDVDGARPNQVTEIDTHAQPWRLRSNPEGVWFSMAETRLDNEAAAARPADPGAGRFWRVTSPARRNSLGQPTGYALLPGVSAVPYNQARSVVRRQASFLDAQLFVTAYRKEEMYAGGEFQNFGPRDEGLSAWIKAARPLGNTDVVLWYTLGVTHLPRPEEYPVMPAARAGFRLVPSGFFSSNPALVPEQ